MTGIANFSAGGIESLIKLPIICPNCGFIAVVPRLRLRTERDCFGCGHVFTPSRLVPAGLAVVAVLLWILPLLAFSFGDFPIWPTCAITAIVAAVAAIVGFVVRRRCSMADSRPNVMIAATLAAVTATVGSVAAMTLTTSESAGWPAMISLAVSGITPLTVLGLGVLAAKLRYQPVGAVPALFAQLFLLICSATASAILMDLADRQSTLHGPIVQWLPCGLPAALTFGVVLGTPATRSAFRIRSRDEINRVVRAVCSQTGLRTQHWMENRIAMAAEQRHESPQEFYEKWLADSDRQGEVAALLSWRTTCFFREPTVLGRLSSEFAGKEIRIKINGAATGEEAYSAAILVKEAGLRRVQVFASDLSPQNIATAEQGKYSPASFEVLRDARPFSQNPLPEILRWRPVGSWQVRREIIDKYFQLESGGRLGARRELREVIEFDVANAVEDRRYEGFDAVFFRNVITHLDEEGVLQALQNILNHGRDGLLLVLARADLKAMPQVAREFLARGFTCCDSSGRQIPLFRKTSR